MPVTFQKHKICLAGAVQYCLIVLVMKEYVEPVEEAVILWTFYVEDTAQNFEQAT
jgi:hypothetical protein